MQNETRVKAAAVLARMADPYCFVGMMCLLPLLEIVQVLEVWALKKGAYICDLVNGLINCQGTLLQLYKDQERAFRGNHLKAFQQLIDCSHGEIPLLWQTDMNEPEQYLAFLWGTWGKESLKAMHNDKPITRAAWAEIVDSVDECSGKRDYLNFTFSYLLSSNRRFFVHLIGVLI